MINKIKRYLRFNNDVMVSYRHRSFQESELKVGKELENLLLFEVADITDNMSLLMFSFTPHSFLYTPFLIYIFGFLIFFYNQFQLLNI